MPLDTMAKNYLYVLVCAPSTAPRAGLEPAAVSSEVFAALDHYVLGDRDSGAYLLRFAWTSGTR